MKTKWTTPHREATQWLSTGEKTYGTYREGRISRPHSSIRMDLLASSAATARADGLERQLHELRTRQLELEMQNEQHRQTNHALLAASDQARQETARLNQKLECRVRQLAESNKDLEAFSYSVAHDLQTPLAAIDGFLNLLDHALTANDLEQVKHCSEQIQAGVQEMGQLTAGLLAVARVSSTELRCEKINLSALAGAILKAHQEQEPQRKVDVRIEPDLWARGDPLLVRQVLVNLLGNAWKFTSQQPHAVITFDMQGAQALSTEKDERGDSRNPRKSKNQTTFVVSDNGAGFDMAYADRLFGTFERLHTQDEFEGTGIGLATVKRIINRHGGCVSAESAPGHGAVFRFTLPSAAPD